MDETGLTHKISDSPDGSIDISVESSPDVCSGSPCFNQMTAVGATAGLTGIS
jgi:hypothetical protein